MTTRELTRIGVSVEKEPDLGIPEPLESFRQLLSSHFELPLFVAPTQQRRHLCERQ